MLKDISKMEQRYEAVTMVMKRRFLRHRGGGEVQRVSPERLPLAGQIRRGRLRGTRRRDPPAPSRAPPDVGRAPRCRSSTCDDAITSGDRFAFSSS